MVNSWIISSVASAVYVTIFSWKVYLSSKNAQDGNGGMNENDGLLFGFCVWSAPLLPTEDGGCHQQNDNSHMYAFYLDMTLAVIVLGKFIYVWKSKNLTTTVEALGVSAAQYIAIAFVILFHGLLHLFLYVRFDCYVPEKDIPGKEQALGHFLFSVFTFIICLIILWFGFVTTGQQRLSTAILWSIGCTFAVYTFFLSTGNKIGIQWILPALFALTHPLSCITGVYSKSPLFTQSLGWLFLLATITGITELVFCTEFLRGIGGHVWYDFFLHLAMIRSLPAFPSGLRNRKIL